MNPNQPLAVQLIFRPRPFAPTPDQPQNPEDPTPEEIKRRCEQLRKTWTPRKTRIAEGAYATAEPSIQTVPAPPAGGKGCSD